MEDVQQTQPVLEVPVTETVEITETAQPVVDAPIAVETEMKVEQTVLQPDAPISSEAVEEPPLLPTAPESQPELPDTIQQSVTKEPSLPAAETSQVKTEQSPALEFHTEPEARADSEPVVSEPVAEDQAVKEPSPSIEENTTDPAPLEAPVDKKEEEP
ncbi:hypothetical protein F66182_15407 [Fusarium sp. NRRL 66182]|nr:hypothetical protein F66182_15407 [Fusarium sp. NRRL 66182]